MAQLRDLIAEHLVGPGVPARPWGVRVVETGAMDPDTALPPFGEQPWISIRQTGSTVDINRVEANNFEISIFGSNTSFTALDILEKLVIGLLNRTTLIDTDYQPHQRYTLVYAGTVLGDQVVPEWDAYVRTLHFTASGTAAWYAPDDPRAAYLRQVTPGMLCLSQGGIDWSGVQTDPKTWTPTDDSPGVYWRPWTGPSEMNRWFEMTQYTEVLAGHVVAGSSQAQDTWVDRVALALPGHVLWDDRPNRRQSTMLLRLVSTDINADALNVGQLRVECIFTELRCPPYPDYPEVRQIVVKESPSMVGSGLPRELFGQRPPPTIRSAQEDRHDATDTAALAAPSSARRPAGPTLAAFAAKPARTGATVAAADAATASAATRATEPARAAEADSARPTEPAVAAKPARAGSRARSSANPNPDAEPDTEPLGYRTNGTARRHRAATPASRKAKGG